jgi:DNA-binding MarR family transcriptional regulator
LRRANQRHAAIFFEGLGDQQLTPTQFAALVKIGDAREISQNRLGRLTAMDPATIWGVVKRLRARELVATRPDPRDRRRSLWRLSDTGRRALEDAVPMAKRITRDTLAPLARGERRRFLELLRKLS